MRIRSKQIHASLPLPIRIKPIYDACTPNFDYVDEYVDKNRPPPTVALATTKFNNRLGIVMH